MNSRIDPEMAVLPDRVTAVRVSTIVAWPWETSWPTCWRSSPSVAGAWSPNSRSSHWASETSMNSACTRTSAGPASGSTAGARGDRATSRQPNQTVGDAAFIGVGRSYPRTAAGSSGFRVLTNYSDDRPNHLLTDFPERDWPGLPRGSFSQLFGRSSKPFANRFIGAGGM